MNLSEKINAKIKWLRIQPENVKVKYIWISALVIFVIVALLWVGIFRKYERKSANDGKSTELIIEEGKKIKDNLESKIEFLDINLPENLSEASPSPSTSSLVSPEISPEVSSEIIPEAL